MLSRTPCRKVPPASTLRPRLIPRTSAQNASARSPSHSLKNRQDGTFPRQWRKVQMKQQDELLGEKRVGSKHLSSELGDRVEARLC